MKYFMTGRGAEEESKQSLGYRLDLNKNFVVCNKKKKIINISKCMLVVDLLHAMRLFHRTALFQIPKKKIRFGVRQQERSARQEERSLTEFNFALHYNYTVECVSIHDRTPPPPPSIRLLLSQVWGEEA